MPVREQILLSGASAVEIAESIEQAIRNGSLSPGDPLPSVRQLASDLEVSPSTAAAAYRRVRERGLVTTHRRSRTRVSLRPPLPTRSQLPLPADVRDLASGNPDPALLPKMEPTLARLEVPRRLYGEASTYEPLADTAATELRALGLPSEHLLVTNGGLDGIERLLDAHLSIGDPVALEDPCYTGVLDLVRAMGFLPRPFAIDAAGPLPDAVDEALSEGASACIVTPRGQNPTGAALDEERAAELREVLARYPEVLAIEDEHAGPVVGAPPLTIIDDRDSWARVLSLNKSLGPDLRVGVLATDPLTMARVQGRQLLGCGWVSHVLQRLTIELWLSSGELLDEAARRYRERRMAVLEALAGHDIAAVGPSGFNIWVPVAEEEPVTRGLLQLGWSVKAGEPYRLKSAPGIRVTTSTLEPDEAPRFASDLARVLRPERTTHLP